MEQSDVRQNKAELHMRPLGRPCNYAWVELQQHWAAGLVGRDRNLNYEAAFGQLAAAGCILSLLFQVRTGHYQDQVAPVAYFQSRTLGLIIKCAIAPSLVRPRAVR